MTWRGLFVSALVGLVAAVVLQPDVDVSCTPPPTPEKLDKILFDDVAWCRGQVDSYAENFQSNPSVASWKQLGMITAWCK